MIHDSLAVASQTFRSAVRTRALHAVAALLALVTLAMSLTLKGDGTASGEIRVLLTWALGTATVIVAIVMLCMACCSLSAEIHDRKFACTRISAAATYSIFAGKWLAHAAIAGILLAMAMLIIYVVTPFRGITHADLRPSLIIKPDSSTVQELLEQNMQILMQANAATNGAKAAVNEKKAAEEFMRGMHDDYSPIRPGESFTWRFAIPDIPPVSMRLHEDSVATVRFISPYGAAQAAMGGKVEVLRIQEDGAPAADPVATTPLTEDDARFVSTPFATHAIAGGACAIAVRLENGCAAEDGAILTRFMQDATISIPCGSFLFNYVRAGLVLWSIISALIAIGIVAGAAFTTPVAVFVASGITAMLLIGNSGYKPDESDMFDAHGHPQSGAVIALAKASRAPISAIASITGPVSGARPLDRIGDRAVIPAKDAMRAVPLIGVSYPLLLGLIAAIILKRREYP